MLRAFKQIFFFILLCSFVCSFPVDLLSGAEKLKIAVSIIPQEEFVKWIGGNKVSVVTMVPAGANPHTFELKPSVLKELANTRIYFTVGSGLEFEYSWMDKIKEINKDMKVVNTSSGVTLLTASEDRNSDSGHSKNSHGRTDPHVWLAPKNVIKMLKNISDALSEDDPDNKMFYGARLENYSNRLEKLDSDIRVILNNKKGNAFMVFHPSFTYFANAYGLIQKTIEHWGKEPTGKHLKSVIDFARREGIKLIFSSPQNSTKTAEVVAKHVGGSVVLVDPLGSDYLENMAKLARAIQRGAR